MIFAGVWQRQCRVFTQSQCTAFPCRPRCPPKGGHFLPRLEKNAVLEKGMTERHGGRTKRDWRSKSKPQWHVSVVEDIAQSSQARWMLSKNNSKWTSLLRSTWMGLITLRERPLTRNKSCKDSVNREETYSGWPRWRPTTRSKKTKRGTTCAKKEEDDLRALLEEMQTKSVGGDHTSWTNMAYVTEQQHQEPHRKMIRRPSFLSNIPWFCRAQPPCLLCNFQKFFDPPSPPNWGGDPPLCVGVSRRGGEGVAVQGYPGRHGQADVAGNVWGLERLLVGKEHQPGGITLWWTWSVL